MGFLDHSTNNIIVDAVLTDRGRELLAAQNSSSVRFNITKFSLSDDEVDYTIIKKYGRTVGKEKIIKNTPIFEAQTKAYLAQKYRLISLSDAVLTTLPTITVSPAALTFNRQIVAQQRQTVRVDTLMSNAVIPAELADENYFVTIPSKLLSITPSKKEIDIDESTSLLNATYLVEGNIKSGNATEAQFTLQVNSTIDDTLLSVYGDGSGNISALISIVGANSGSRQDLTFTITSL